MVQAEITNNQFSIDHDKEVETIDASYNDFKPKCHRVGLA
jgi:hypothetical protein